MRGAEGLTATGVIMVTILFFLLHRRCVRRRSSGRQNPQEACIISSRDDPSPQSLCSEKATPPPSPTSTLSLPCLGQLPRPCNCFLNSNIYIDKIDGVNINRHFVFESESAFRAKYGPFLHTLGSSKTAQLLEAIARERKRRMNEDPGAAARKEQLKLAYVPLDPEVMILKDEYLRPEFLEILRQAVLGRKSEHLQVR